MGLDTITHASPGLYVFHSCAGSSGDKSLGSVYQPSDTLKTAVRTNVHFIQTDG